jgi:hypothetical protein
MGVLVVNTKKSLYRYSISCVIKLVKYNHNKKDNYHTEISLIISGNILND